MTKAGGGPARELGFLAALPVGICGAALFYVLHLPLPFVLGPMYLCLTFNLIFPVLTCPRWVRPPVVALIGVMLGTAFRPELIQALGNWLVPLLGLLTVIAATIAANYMYYRNLAGFDNASAFYSSAPGGLTEMVILGGQSGGKETDIALAHSSRILLVVLLLPWAIRYILGIPFSGRSVSGPPLMDTGLLSTALIGSCALAGAFLGKFLKFPAYAFLGPMALSASLHLGGASDFLVPKELVMSAQLLLGISVGAGFVGIQRHLVARAMFFGLGASLIMLLIALTGAWTISRLSPFKISELLLAFAPGGFPEMSIIAYALGVDVALVATFHVARIAIVVLAVPLISRVALARSRIDSGKRVRDDGRGGVR